jgi:ferredoxin
MWAFRHGLAEPRAQRNLLVERPECWRYCGASVPKIEFLANSIGAAKVVDVPAGGELVDICDHYFAPIPFSCRSASCGTCHIEIVEGASLLEPPEEAEEELLDILGGDGATRLACQARVKAGPGLVRIRAKLG